MAEIKKVNTVSSCGVQFRDNRGKIKKIAAQADTRTRRTIRTTVTGSTGIARRAGSSVYQTGKTMVMQGGDISEGAAMISRTKTAVSPATSAIKQTGRAGTQALGAGLAFLSMGLLSAVTSKKAKKQLNDLNILTKKDGRNKYMANAVKPFQKKVENIQESNKHLQAKISGYKKKLADMKRSNAPQEAIDKLQGKLNKLNGDLEKSKGALAKAIEKRNKVASSAGKRADRYIDQIGSTEKVTVYNKRRQINKQELKNANTREGRARIKSRQKAEKKNQSGMVSSSDRKNAKQLTKYQSSLAKRANRAESAKKRGQLRLKRAGRTMRRMPLNTLKQAPKSTFSTVTSMSGLSGEAYQGYTYMTKVSKPAVSTGKRGARVTLRIAGRVNDTAWKRLTGKTMREWRKALTKKTKNLAKKTVKNTANVTKRVVKKTTVEAIRAGTKFNAYVAQHATNAAVKTSAKGLQKTAEGATKLATWSAKLSKKSAELAGRTAVKGTTAAAKVGAKMSAATAKMTAKMTSKVAIQTTKAAMQAATKVAQAAAHVAMLLVNVAIQIFTWLVMALSLLIALIAACLPIIIIIGIIAAVVLLCIKFPAIQEPDMETGETKTTLGWTGEYLKGLTNEFLGKMDNEFKSMNRSTHTAKVKNEKAEIVGQSAYYKEYKTIICNSISGSPDVPGFTIYNETDAVSCKENYAELVTELWLWADGDISGKGKKSLSELQSHLKEMYWKTHAYQQKTYASFNDRPLAERAYKIKQEEVVEKITKYNKTWTCLAHPNQTMVTKTYSTAAARDAATVQSENIQSTCGYQYASANCNCGVSFTDSTSNEIYHMEKDDKGKYKKVVDKVIYIKEWRCTNGHLMGHFESENQEERNKAECPVSQCNEIIPAHVCGQRLTYMISNDVTTENRYMRNMVKKNADGSPMRNKEGQLVYEYEDDYNDPNKILDYAEFKVYIAHASISGASDVFTSWMTEQQKAAFMQICADPDGAGFFSSTVYDDYQNSGYDQTIQGRDPQTVKETNTVSAVPLLAIGSPVGPAAYLNTDAAKESLKAGGAKAGKVVANLAKACTPGFIPTGSDETDYIKLTEVLGNGSRTAKIKVKSGGTKDSQGRTIEALDASIGCDQLGYIKLIYTGDGNMPKEVQDIFGKETLTADQISKKFKKVGSNPADWRPGDIVIKSDSSYSSGSYSTIGYVGILYKAGSDAADLEMKQNGKTVNGAAGDWCASYMTSGTARNVFGVAPSDGVTAEDITFTGKCKATFNNNPNYISRTYTAYRVFE